MVKDLCALAKPNIEAQSAELMKTEKLVESFAFAKARKKVYLMTVSINQ